MNLGHAEEHGPTGISWRDNSVKHYALWVNWLDSSLAKEDLVDTKLTMNKRSTLAAKNTNSCLDCIRKDDQLVKGCNPCSLLSLGEATFGVLCQGPASQYKRDSETLCESSEGWYVGLWRSLRTWSICHMRRGWDGTVQLREEKGGTYQGVQIPGRRK